MGNGVLIAFGLFWMVVAALLGLYLGARHIAHLESLDELARRGDLAQFHRAFEVYKWRSSIHGHGMLFSLSAIAVGLILPQTGFSGTAVAAVVGTLIVATVAWTLSGLKRIRPLMGLADVMFIATIAVVAWGVARSAWS